MTDPQDRWPLVGTAVTQRMTWLGLSQADVSKGSDLAPVTVRAFMRVIRNNSRPAARTKFSRALGWPPDAIQRILDGEDPSTFEDDPPPSGPGTVVPIDRRRAEPEPEPDQVELAALVGQLPPDKRAAIEQLVRTMLEAD